MYNTLKGFHFGKFLMQLAVFTIVIFGLHIFIIQNYFTNINFYYETWEIYVFQFTTVAILIFFLNQRSKIRPNKVFHTYIILSILKMLAVVLFLLPLFLKKTPNSKPAVFSFFIAYFIFLIAETRYAVKILNKKI